MQIMICVANFHSLLLVKYAVYYYKFLCCFALGELLFAPLSAFSKFLKSHVYVILFVSNLIQNLFRQIYYKQYNLVSALFCSS